MHPICINVRHIPTWNLIIQQFSWYRSVPQKFPLNFRYAGGY